MDPVTFSTTPSHLFTRLLEKTAPARVSFLFLHFFPHSLCSMATCLSLPPVQTEKYPQNNHFKFGVETQ
jgi:hypothetical protein